MPSDSPFLRKRKPPPGPAARAAAKTAATTVKPRSAAAAPVKSASARGTSELYQRMLADLQRSGLDAADARVMRLEPYARGELESVLPEGAGYRIPYFTREGAPRTDMFRYRYLEDTRRKGFGQLGSAKQRRYTQPTGSPPGVYWAPFTAWNQIAAQPDVPLLITEGEKKAAIATKLGMPCIGLGGVWSFRSKSIGTRLLSELQEVDWAERTVIIVYDSDAVLNMDVCRAEIALANELTAQGAVVKVARLPELVEGEKCGLDDYIVSEGIERLLELCDSTEPFSLGAELHRMNSEVIYVQDPGVVHVRATGQTLRPSDFTAHRFADRQYTKIVPGPKGAPVMQVRQTAPDWVKWPQRAVAKRFVFAPGEDEITPAGELNIWKGWPHLPVKGDIKPWTQLLDFIFDGQPETRAYFERWAAYPIQNPGVKLRTAVAVWGVRKGTGKSLIGYTLGDLYGDAFMEISDKHIDGSNDFNSWAKGRQFILGDEITGNDARKVANQLKHMISRETVEINIKNLPQYTLPDRLNYYFTSNAPDCFYLEEDERRLLIHEVKGEKLEQEFYKAYDRWRRSKEGRAALMWHLMYGVNTAEFDPMAAPPVTSAKTEMIALTRTELEAWLIQLREYPDLFCSKFNDSDLISLQEISVLHEAEGLKPASTILMARKLKELGIDALYPTDAPDKSQIFAGGRLVRLFALRNAKKWARATTEQLRTEYEQSRGLAPKSKRQKF